MLNLLLGQDAWKQDPNQRPSARQLVNRLRKLLIQCLNESSVINDPEYQECLSLENETKSYQGRRATAVLSKVVSTITKGGNSNKKAAETISESKSNEPLEIDNFSPLQSGHTNLNV